MDRQTDKKFHRIIAAPSPEVKLVIKTNLDPQTVTEENPYVDKRNKASEELKAFFEGEKK
ncbi:hypothetical protein B0I26_10290 [Anoxybacillus vitaminiphilus]|uniref:Uncharacterized protein n=1 Tax=Paranoxybacillus vitaminiphilus TaxID=581036 RepID=A0A327YNJ8_9BACL|nr:hypothetical protein [Anoxybacillus vitaminiphilus]RAK22102.1 hypothetical protein B0I26_10290 [Anoxybacillus vitaminiphilus]